MKFTNLASLSSDKFIWKGLTLTESAANQIKTLASDNPKIKGLWLGIKQSGCAGFCYIMNLVTDPSEHDLIFIRHGVTIYVSLQAMPFIDGTQIDFVYEGLNQVFKFNNPKAKHSCGCGESFSIE